MSAKINISVNLSNSINWETHYQSLTYTVQNVNDKSVPSIINSCACGVVY